MGQRENQRGHERRTESIYAECPCCRVENPKHIIPETGDRVCADFLAYWENDLKPEILRDWAWWWVNDLKGEHPDPFGRMAPQWVKDEVMGNWDAYYAELREPTWWEKL